MPRANVPFFDQSIDLADPLGAGKTFAYMSIGAAAFLGALAVGRWGLQQAQNTTGVGSDVGIPVAGD